MVGNLGNLCKQNESVTNAILFALVKHKNIYCLEKDQTELAETDVKFCWF